MIKNSYQNGQNILSSILPKIHDYFTKNQFLEKKQLSNFLSSIDLSLTIEKEKDFELFWSQLSKDSTTKDKISKNIIIKNLSEYIKSNNQNIFQPEQSLKNSVLQFISNPKKLNIGIDPDNDEHFELYLLFASLQFNNDKIIQINSLKEKLDNYKFINLNKEYLSIGIEELVKEKVDIIKKEQYLAIMEEMSKKFGNILEEKSKIRKVFAEEELNNSELKEFDDIDTIIKILFNILSSIYQIHYKCCECFKNKDNINGNYFNRYFNVFVDNQKLFLYEIYKIYNLQKQKFNFYECALENKNILHKQKITQLNEEIKRQKDIEEIANYDNLKSLNEELKKERKKIQLLENDIKTLKEENQNKFEEKILLENKILTLEKNLQEKQNNINALKKENELMSKKYKEVLDTLDRQLYFAKEKEKFDDEIFKKMNLNEKQKLLINKKPQDLIAYIVEKDNYCLTLENKNKNLIDKITKLEKSQDDIDKNFYEMKSKLLTLENKIVNLKKENESLQNLINENKNKNGVYLNNLLEDEDEQEKKYNFIEVKISQFYYKGIVTKKKEKETNIRNYDYLCLKMNEKILQNIEDEYYNGSSNLFFSELINYLDEEKQTTECALFITSEYLYFFNNITFQKAFSIQIDELRTVFISPLNNYVSMTFYEGETINFELFRILDLMNFIKSLNALYKTKQKIEINMSDFNNQFVNNIKNNFTVSPYHGRAFFSGYIHKRIESFLKTGFEKRFAILTEIGLVIMDKPNGKPLEIINILFAKWDVYNGGDGDYCFCLNIGKIKHTFSVDSDFLRNKWIEEFSKWIKKIQEEESIMI